MLVADIEENRKNYNMYDISVFYMFLILYLLNENCAKMAT